MSSKKASAIVPPAETLPLSDDQFADLRSDHAGETGAVWIYRGILAVSPNPEVQGFARIHLAAEERHLAFFESWLPAHARSRVLPLWRLAGWLTGALPALFGPSAVYATIASVESFVDEHYAAQTKAMAGDPRLAALHGVLEGFRLDEAHHRDDARSRVPGRHGLLARIWRRMVGAGSVAGVALARRL
jgi:ubiquinone biosynthesis monooxygenase Coq7